MKKLSVIRYQLLGKKSLCFLCFFAANTAFAILDTDGDAVSDFWEKQFNGGALFSSTFSLTEDSDGDGWTNGQEVAAGTSPFSANAPFGIVQMSIQQGVSSGIFDISWNALKGKKYQVQTSSSLALGSWQNMGAAEIADSDSMSYIVDVMQTDGSLPPRSFWRLEISDTDTDNDDLTDAEEYSMGTSPYYADTDLDGLNDKSELLLGTSPLNADTDNDGLKDGQEISLTTNALAADTDSDGVNDGDEVANGTNPKAADTDGDGLTDGDERNRGLNPLNADTDGDTISDYNEVINGLNPLLADSDLDGINDNVDSTSLSNNVIANPDRAFHDGTTLNNNLQSFWSFESTVVGNPMKYVNDTWAANPLTMSAITTSTTDSMFSKAACFNAFNSSLVASASTLADKANWTVAFWCKFDQNYIQTKSTNVGTVLFSHNQINDGYPEYFVEVYRGAGVQVLNFAHYAGSTLQNEKFINIPLTNALDNGRWTHLAFTKSGSTVKAYRDGILLDSYTKNTTFSADSTGSFVIGRLTQNGVGDTSFHGCMDRFAVYSRGLSDIEVLSHYRADSDKDGLWDTTETATSFTGLLNSNGTHPTTPQPGGLLYGSSPYYYNVSNDTDQDGLSDIEEQNYYLTKIDNPDTDGDRMPDGWEAAANWRSLNIWGTNSVPVTGTFATFNLLANDAASDFDNDGLSNLDEYLNGSDPRNPNTDGSGGNDAAEITLGSDPNNNQDDDAPDPLETQNLPIHVYGDYTVWEVTLKGFGPDDRKIRRFQMTAHNVSNDVTVPIIKGNKYELTMKYISTKPGEQYKWYCWETKLDGKTDPYFILFPDMINTDSPWLVQNQDNVLSNHTHSPNENKVSGKKVTIIPQVLYDVKDLANTNDDVVIQKWNGTSQIKDENIAWIEAHKSATDPAPRMPQLELRLTGLAAGAKIHAKLQVKYDRGNGNRTFLNKFEDTVKIPANGDFQEVAGDTWKIYELYNTMPFFGGEATFTYKIVKDGAEVLAPQTIKFRIGGKNPEPAKAKAYIETLPDCNPQGNLWFAYAIAKSESKDYNGEGSRYNQFLRAPANPNDNGRPLWGDDGGSSPGGYGLFQVTGTATKPTEDIPRKEIWNWQENTKAGLIILKSKRKEADSWMLRQRGPQNANGIAVPNLTIINTTFIEGTNKTINDTVTMKAYNGASRPSDFVDNDGIASGFIIDPTASGHYCSWKNTANKWALSRFNNFSPPFNYVKRVCQEIEP